MKRSGSFVDRWGRYARQPGSALRTAATCSLRSAARASPLPLGARTFAITVSTSAIDLSSHRNAAASAAWSPDLYPLPIIAAIVRARAGRRQATFGRGSIRMNPQGGHSGAKGTDRRTQPAWKAARDRDLAESEGQAWRHSH